MTKSKKDRYIRDLFEEDFYKNFSKYLCNLKILDLFIEFYNSRIKVKCLLLSNRNFHDIPILGFSIIRNDEVFTIEKFDKIIYEIEYRELFYLICDFIQKYKTVKNKTIIMIKFEDIIRKILNKSIDKYLEKNDFILFLPSRSSIVLNTLLEILKKINLFLLKEINPGYKAERTIDDIEKRNTFIVYEYEQIVNIIESYKIIRQDIIKSKKHYENMSIEDCIKYNISKLTGIDILDERLDFVIHAFQNIKLNKKDLAFQYLREKYNITSNNDTLDKILDRGRNKRKKREIDHFLYKRIDNYLCMANLQDKLNHNNLLNWIGLFDCEMDNLAKKLKIFS